MQHAFKSFGKWCSFPQEFEATREKITQDTNYYLQLTQRKEKHTKKRKNIANFYVTRNIILQSASCFQHFLLSNINPVSQSTQLTLSRNFPFSVLNTTMGGYIFLRKHSYCTFLCFHEIFLTYKLHGIWRFIFKKTLDKIKDALSVMIWPNCCLLRSHTQFKGRW